MIGKSNRNCWAVVTQQYVDVTPLVTTPNLFSSFKKARTEWEKEVKMLVNNGWKPEIEESTYSANARIYDDEMQNIIYEVYVDLITIK